ncbi:MAG: hypothetical protein NC419_02185 [Muribaculaceae bacterium]|nr:hypothetical protein [Muribaculaceae bacterium]
MDKIINRYQAICGTVWILIFCIVITLWPLRLVKETVVSGSNRQMAMQSEAIADDYTVMQMFVAQYDYLQKVSVYLLNESAGEEFRFVLYDASLQVLMDQVISTDEMEEMPGFCTIQVNQPTEVGREYYYLIQGISTDFYVAYEDTASSGTIYNGTLFYGDVEDTEHNIITEYRYRIPLRKGKTLLCDVLLVLFGFLVSIAAKRYYAKYPQRNRLLTVEMVWKKVATPLIIIAALLCMAAIWPLQLFSKEVENNLFMEIGILATAGILLYGLRHKRSLKSHDMGLSILRERWQDYLQAVFFACAIQAGVHYMNGLYELHHMIAYREMLIWFGLAVIVTYRKKEIFHPANLLYLVIAAVWGVIYYREHVTAARTEEEVRVVWLGVCAAIVSGVVILNTILIFIRRGVLRLYRKNSCLWYGGVLAVFFALLVLFRNTRGWPVYLVCAFTLYYIRMAVWDKKAGLLRNICNGILLHFLVMVGYCLLHRPYMFFIYTRYPFIFHTVTVSAVYLLLVVCAALAKLLDVYRKEPALSHIWKELTVFGVAVVYLIFTLSRTGYLAMAVMAVFVIPIVCFGMRRPMWAFGRFVGMLFLTVILCFTAVFTAQRIVPAVVAQPETMEIEELPSEIVHGRDLDSKYYITIRRFLQVFEMKVLGIPEEKCIKSFDYAQDEGKKAGAEMLVASVELPDEEILVASSALSGKEILTASVEPSGEGILVASAELSEEEAQHESDAEAYTNGRLEIFALYFNNLNMTGHEEMGITLPDGRLVVHAHNIYLQTAYDHGIPVGIVFVLFGICTLVRALTYYRKHKDDRSCSILPLALLLAFAVAGLTEWIFHPCHPIAFCLLLTLAPLFIDAEADKRYGNETEAKTL